MGGMVVLEVEGGGGRRGWWKRKVCAFGWPALLRSLSLSLMKKKRERDEGMVDRGEEDTAEKVVVGGGEEDGSGIQIFMKIPPPSSLSDTALVVGEEEKRLQNERGKGMKVQIRGGGDFLERREWKEGHLPSILPGGLLLLLHIPPSPFLPE